MNDARIAPAKSFSGSVLNGAAGLWLAVAVLGQWAFAYYIANFYGPAMATGDYQAWSALSAMGAKAYVAGDDAGNRFFGAHALAAGVVAIGGALQLMPFVRNRWPKFHRWNGRVFMLTVTGLSLTGFWLVWVRNGETTIGATTVNGLLILAFVGLALHAAMTKRFAIHERWATRLYLVSNAQWFTRVGFFAYFMGSMALGAKPSMDDPFISFWAWGCFLVPLAVAELYLRARDRGGPWARFATALIIVAMTLIMAAGMFAFGMFSLRLISGEPLTLAG